VVVLGAGVEAIVDAAAAAATAAVGVGADAAGGGTAGTLVSTAGAAAAAFLGLVTMTTRKSFSLILQLPIVSSSFNTFPE
jgi:hypothetical protein